LLQRLCGVLVTREIKEAFIWIPKPTGYGKIEISGVDYSKRVYESEFVKPCTIGLGSFSCKLVNAKNDLDDLFSAGDEIVFSTVTSYNGTREQFKGRVDYPINNLSSKGKFLELEGRHKAFHTTETRICYRTSGEEPSEIVKDIIDTYLANYGYTYSNVNATSLSMPVNWSYVPFWDCIKEICDYSGFDFYIDNDLDSHFFEADSILNSDEAVVEGQNLLQNPEWGKNDIYERTRVIAQGQDDEGLPIIHTEIDSGEGNVVREESVYDASANTLNKVTALAQSKLNSVTGLTPQAMVYSKGLETLEPGENIWISIPRQNIQAQYKILQLTHKFGRNGWRTDCMIEREFATAGKLIWDRVSDANKAIPIGNVNKLNFSVNYTFDDDTLTSSHSDTSINDGKLILASESDNSGTWISTTTQADSNVSSIELRTKGTDLTFSTFYFSLDNGDSWEQIVKDTLVTPSQTNGQNLKAKVILNKNWSNLSPQLNSMAFLYN